MILLVGPAKTHLSLHIHVLWPIFARCTVGNKWSADSSGRQQRLWSTCAYPQADPSLRFARVIFTTYNVLLRYLAFVSRCYSLTPIMLKIFDVICQLADDFYEKQEYIFPYFSRILPLQVRQSLFTITLNNLQVTVFRQRSNIFLTVPIKIKAP